MQMNASAVLKLCDGFARIESHGSMDECLDELSELTARVLGAGGCTICLLNEAEVEQAGLRDGAGFGTVPARFGRSGHAFPPSLAPDERPAASIVRGGHGDMESMVSTIVLHRKIIGVIHAGRPLHENGFSKDDVDLLSLLTPLITKSIQVIQLQNILNSRFTQIALARSNESTMAARMAGVLQNPNQIARILAKSFYREMLSAGFNVNQIISAASEVISELSASLRKHKASRKQREIKPGEILELLFQASSEGEAVAPQSSADGVQETLAA